jgi:hypothetical protein
MEFIELTLLFCTLHIQEQTQLLDCECDCLIFAKEEDEPGFPCKIRMCSALELQKRWKCICGVPIKVTLPKSIVKVTVNSYDTSD